MNEFLKGMNTIGQLLPNPYPYSGYPARDAAWQDTANSFNQVGNSIKHAIKDFSDAQRQSKQTP